MISCILIDDEPGARKLLEECVHKTSQLHLLASFDSAVTAWDFLKNTPVDLVFSDILLPDLDGISLLKNLNKPPLFVFVTGSPEYAAEGFNLDTIDYIVKPFDYGRFLKAVHKAEIFLNKDNAGRSSNDYLVVKDGHKNVVLKHKDIFYIQGNREYVTVATEEKNYLIQKTMTYMESVLPPDQFIRAHKSFIVNINFVREILHKTIIMKGSIKDISIGSQYRNSLYKHLGIR